LEKEPLQRLSRDGQEHEAGSSSSALERPAQAQEPIFHRDLETDHAEVIEAIRWMSADTADWAMLTSRFPEVFRAG
jgi:hypothetical protein